jgi:hypothetical protein
VVCFDAPKDHIIVPCGHQCVCEACANLLTQMYKPTCPICRAYPADQQGVPIIAGW